MCLMYIGVYIIYGYVYYIRVCVLYVQIVLYVWVCIIRVGVYYSVGVCVICMDVYICTHFVGCNVACVSYYRF